MNLNQMAFRCPDAEVVDTVRLEGYRLAFCICNNANQLAKVANTYGEASQQDIEEMTKLARQVWEEVKENW